MFKANAQLLCLQARLHRLYHTAVLSFGAGSQGALGCDSLGDNYEAEETKLAKDIQKVAAGHYHSLAVNAEGHLWSWGRNNEQQLGHQNRVQGPIAAPAVVQGFCNVQVKDAAASGVASFAVLTDGTVWSWGSSKRGQLGLGTVPVPQKVAGLEASLHGVTTAPVPQRVAGLEGITSVSAGWGHACALREDGQVFSWGYPQHGRLGHSLASTQALDEEAAIMQRLVWEPHAADLLHGLNIKQITCGSDHTLAVSQEGHAYAFGDNSLGQLSGQRSMGVLTKDLDPQQWVVKNADGADLLFSKVAAGLGHCLGVTSKGDVVAWGWNAADQLGLGYSQKEQVVYFPTQIYGLPENSNALVAAARVHSILASEDLFVDSEAADAPHDETLNSLTQVYAWGSGHNGRLGLGMQQDMTVPEMVSELDGADILDIACGYDHTLVLIKL